MGRVLHRLSAVNVASQKRAGYYADGGNLYLRVAPGGTKGWIFRFAQGGKTRDAGLGSYPAVTLIRAREEAERFRRLVAAGIDPIQARVEEREAAKTSAKKATTFEQCAKAFIASHEVGWRNDKHRQQWRSTLQTYCYPTIGALPVQVIETDHVVKILEPIWASKPETASRVRQRVERVLSWAKVRGYREGENPAQWRGHLDHLLPAKGKVRAVRHHPALPYQEMGTLMAQLREDSSISGRALEFLILTASRTSEALGALWAEIDVGERMWTVPAARMKAAKAHRVPLSPRALTIVREMAAIRQNEFIFPGRKPHRPLSQTALLMLLRRRGYGHITGHGFRSSFRDWAAEQTSSSREVAEMALAHTVPDAVEAAYRRGDLFQKRRKLMELWANYCGRAPGAAVIPLKHSSA